jgi:thiosulfate reductase cytochrome b subunit
MAPQLGKGLIVIGLLLVAAGAAIWALDSVPMIGRLPGDIYVRRGNLTIYFPITTAIVISIILSLLMALLRR